MYKDSYHIIGVMSGTSLDGVDLGYVNFSFNNKWNYKIFNAITYNYTDQWRKRLLNSINLSKADLHNLDVDYTDELFANQVIELMNELDIQKATLIGLSNGGRVISKIAYLR